MSPPRLLPLLALALAFTIGCEDVRVVNTDSYDAGHATHPDAGADASSDGGVRCDGGDACAPLSSSDGSTFDATNADAEDGSALDDASFVDAASVPAGYPRGPYGALVGDTITALAWQGYVDPNATGLASEAPFALYSMDDVRKSGTTLALIHVSDFDCPGCNHAANDLGQLGKNIVDLGVTVVEVLGSHGYSLPASRTYLDAWVTAHDLAVTSVIDRDDGLETLTTIGVRETALIVDLSTMKIVWRFNGDLGGIDPSSITNADAELHRRLGD